nr:toll/interleukin-1 receptor domain-containing protein [uncultured Cohaesibacter sp.]
MLGDEQPAYYIVKRPEEFRVLAFDAKPTLAFDPKGPFEATAQYMYSAIGCVTRCKDRWLMRVREYHTDFRPRQASFDLESGMLINLTEELNGVAFFGKWCITMPAADELSPPIEVTSFEWKEPQTRLTKLFFSYSHADENFRDTLEKHLSALKHEGLIDSWHDRKIRVGDEFDNVIDECLERADVILLLISSDFIASRYCFEIEMKRALERHAEGTARVIPIILRHCDWKTMPFAKLMAAPTDGKPIKAWADIDEAYTDVTSHIRMALSAMKPREQAQPTGVMLAGGCSFQAAQHPEPVSRSIRSSNLRVRKNFSEADQEEFLVECFSFMSRYFDNSLQELTERHPGIEGRFRQIDANRFTCVIYMHGKAASRCKIMLGGMFGKGISYSMNDGVSDNSCNENLSVQNDDQDLYLTPIMGMRFRGCERDMKLSAEGAAEFYWTMLIEPIQ